MSDKNKKPHNPFSKEEQRKVWENFEIPDNLWEALNVGGMYADLFDRIDDPELKKEMKAYAEQCASDIQPTYTKLLNLVKDQDFRDNLFHELIKRSGADVKRWKPKQKSSSINPEAKNPEVNPEPDSEQ